MDKCITKSEKSPGHREYDCRLLEDNYYMEDGKSPFTPKNTLKPGVKVVIADASMWKREHPLTYMTEYKCHALLKHPLVEAWLTYKFPGVICKVDSLYTFVSESCISGHLQQFRYWDVSTEIIKLL
ncbi:hypothetical protein Pcinc_029100 [Petrolisthes cinctipes]|uniref:Uncharacterized protein n=1 Tax=Petrolisthes cinctipes TaxID=88211 RepID=A0AAE1EQD1_PETCI|nr:hypothetical protein Pcinc_034384 [Petrolisthes cinctipes]KAK3865281.1 hypothetical protein Pcinc_029100 [Petrolisthes cinctipes]